MNVPQRRRYRCPLVQQVLCKNPPDGWCGRYDHHVFSRDHDDAQCDHYQNGLYDHALSGQCWTPSMPKGKKSTHDLNIILYKTQNNCF